MHSNVRAVFEAGHPATDSSPTESIAISNSGHPLTFHHPVGEVWPRSDTVSPEWVFWEERRNCSAGHLASNPAQERQAQSSNQLSYNWNGDLVSGRYHEDCAVAKPRTRRGWPLRSRLRFRALTLFATWPL